MGAGWLLPAPNRTLRPVFPISNIERLLTRGKQTVGNYFLCVVERRLTATSGPLQRKKNPAEAGSTACTIIFIDPASSIITNSSSIINHGFINLDVTVVMMHCRRDSLPFNSQKPGFHQ